MKRLWIPAITLLLCADRAAGQAQGTGWEAPDKVFGQIGKDLPGDVHRYGWPRSDLRVTTGSIPIEPALALGSWAAFRKTGAGEGAVTMGDLVLLGSEVGPVIGELQVGGFEILAIHNHLIGESPRVLYLHFHGRGEAAALAKTLKNALGKTKTPASSGKAPAKPNETRQKILDRLQEVLGHRGTLAGNVLQVGVPRAEAIQEGGVEIPASMGMANAMNFETVGPRVATTGDFVLIADEVNPVIKELRAHGLLVTALHSHMLREKPRLFFMHFWGVGAPEEIGEGLKAALSKVATR